MAQIGVLFDTQKLGAGFYGYSAFRILFSVLKSAELAGCSLYHGVVYEGSGQSYCIAIECDRPRAVAAIRQRLTASVARGLAPRECRFLEESDLNAEPLALAAGISETGALVDCKSKWLLEVWQRSQTALMPSPPPVIAQPAAAPQPVESKLDMRIPDRVPFPLWWSHHGRRAFALMMAFCFGGALLPLLGCGVALCGMLAVAGAVQGAAMQWRLWAELQLSGEDTLEEVKKMIGARTPEEICQRLERPGPQSSPLLRALQSITRNWSTSRDAVSAAAILEQHRKAEEHILRADLEELRFVSWGVPALALCSFYAMQVFIGVGESWMEAPRLALAGASGWLVIEGLRCAVRSSAERLYGDIARLTLASWLPALEKAIPAQAAAARPKAMSATA